MLQVYIVDRSAEARTRLLDRLQGFLDMDVRELEFIPRVNMKPIAREELKYHAAPDVCVVGPELLSEELTEIGKLRKLLPHTPILVCTSSETEGLGTIEQIARLGADDTLFSEASSLEFLRKLILLSRKIRPRQSGQLVVVDSGKGGVGVTSVAAALGEAAAQGGKKTLLVDFDTETQDLSRFLQARPFLNENLQHIFDGSRPLTEEYVEQCYTQLWDDEPNLFCMQPIPESDLLYALGGNYPRTLLSVLEYLDESFDCVIIDAGSIRGALQKSLYRVADKVVFVLNNDPATLYGSVERISKIRDALAANASLTVVENASGAGIPRKLLVEEFGRAARLESSDWFNGSILFSKTAQRWPGSGETLLSAGNAAIAKALGELAQRLELVEALAEGKAASPIGYFQKLLARCFGEKSTAQPILSLGFPRKGQKQLPAPEVSDCDSERTQSLVKSSVQKPDPFEGLLGAAILDTPVIDEPQISEVDSSSSEPARKEEPTPSKDFSSLISSATIQ